MDKDALKRRLRELRDQRRNAQASGRRKTLSRVERAQVLASTDARCHVCGGAIDKNERWQADHVLAHSAGGAHALSNYLPAHALCNNYRWNYSPEEFQWVLKIGVWTRLQMEKDSAFGEEALRRFCDYENRREARSMLDDIPNRIFPERE